jgi:hypothetical protein
MPIIHSRPKKLNHADTVLYEIYMLRFAADRLKREQWDDQKDAWAYLEAFLLHYRNLIEFLGKKPKNIRPTDLHVTTIWKLLKATPPKDASKINQEGAKLWAKYEGVEDRISRYLQHCTTRRTRAKSWGIDEMSDEIEPLLAPVEAALRPRARNPLVKPLPAVPFLGPHEASTTVSTNTSPRAVEIKPVESPRQFE